jgi:anti-anti-sigma regulatory factor
VELIMPTHAELRWTVAAGFPTATARLIGTLNATTVGTAHAALTKALTDQPSVLVIDVGGLRCDDGVWLSLFTTIARRAGEWPGTELLLCCASEHLAAQLRRGATRRLAHYATMDEALAVAGRRPAPRRIRFGVVPLTSAPAEARDVALSVFERWELPMELRDAAELVVSELVTNAVRHAQTEAELILQLTDRFLHVAVRDGATEQPVLQHGVDVHADHGRGLQLVGMIASGWGTIAEADGKVVWATLRRP